MEIVWRRATPCAGPNGAPPSRSAAALPARLRLLTWPGNCCAAVAAGGTRAGSPSWRAHPAATASAIELHLQLLPLLQTARCARHGPAGLLLLQLR